MPNSADQKKFVVVERWSFPFTLVTCDRTYELQASCEDERLLWVHSFTWIIEQNYFKVKIYLDKVMNKSKEVRMSKNSKPNMDEEDT